MSKGRIAKSHVAQACNAAVAPLSRVDVAFWQVLGISRGEPAKRGGAEKAPRRHQAPGSRLRRVKPDGVPSAGPERCHFPASASRCGTAARAPELCWARGAGMAADRRWARAIPRASRRSPRLSVSLCSAERRGDACPRPGRRCAASCWIVVSSIAPCRRLIPLGRSFLAGFINEVLAKGNVVGNASLRPVESNTLPL